MIFDCTYSKYSSATLIIRMNNLYDIDVVYLDVSSYRHISRRTKRYYDL